MDEDKLYICQDDILDFLTEIEETLLLCGLEADPISLVAMIGRQLGTQTRV